MIRRTCLVIVALACLTACSSSAVGHVSTVTSPGATVTVRAAGPCPGSLGGARDVARQPGLPHDRLLPSGLPSRGLICEYQPAAGGGNRLLHAVTLDAARSRRLARAVDRVSLEPAKGKFNCPAGLFGSETVIAFGYPADRSVDLWYLTSGCPTLDNGDVLAFSGADPSFYNRFQTAFAALVPAPAP